MYRLQMSAISLPILILLTTMTGCAVQEPIVRTETITLTEEVLVPVDPDLAKQEPVPQLPLNFDAIDLGAAYLDTVKALKLTNERLREISELK